MLYNLTPENIARWKRQIDTPYNDLSEKEKESDREWARTMLRCVRKEESGFDAKDEYINVH
jgi:hypothetical protein